MEQFIGLLGGYAGICIFIFLFFAILWFIVFLILRPLVMWYLKINTIINKQEIANEYLSKLVEQNNVLIKHLSKQEHNSTHEETYNREYEKYMPK